MKDAFRLSPFAYWETHYHFRYASPYKDKTIGDKALDILLINTVAPMFFVYGLHHKRPEYCDRAIQILERLHHKRPEYCDRAIQILERIRPEKNTIVSHFCQAGITVRHAGDTQALIQLKREYCEKKKCLFCRIGFQLLKVKQTENALSFKI